MGSMDFSGLIYLFYFGAACFGLVIGLTLLLLASLTGFWSYWLLLTLPVFSCIPVLWLKKNG
jgi:hypothetical protein